MKFVPVVIAAMSLLLLCGCSGGPADEAVKDTGPAMAPEQVSQAGGPGSAAGQKGDFKPLPP